MKAIVVILCLFVVSSADAFNWNKCKKGYFDRSTGMGHWFAGVLTSTYGTSEFVSSTGECAMIGMAEHDKKVFIAHNLDQITIDAARGQGEYLSAYASLSGCSKSTSEKFGNTLQSNFTKVFGQKVDHSPKQVYGKIEGVISNDPELKKLCRPRT